MINTKLNAYFTHDEIVEVMIRIIIFYDYYCHGSCSCCYLRHFLRRRQLHSHKKTRVTEIHSKALKNDCGDEILSWIILCIFMNQLLPIFYVLSWKSGGNDTLSRSTFKKCFDVYADEDMTHFVTRAATCNLDVNND